MRILSTTAAVATSACAFLAGAAGGAPLDATFTDPTGDPTKPATPDITGVQVAGTPDGVLTFRITIANYQALPPLSAVVVGVDVDRKLETGSDSVDAIVAYVTDPFGDAETDLARWDAAEDDFVDVDPLPATVSASFTGGVVTLTVPRSELFYTSSFRFAVVSLELDGVFDQDPGVDQAPDGNDYWSYELVVPPAALAASAPIVAPRRPLAGKTVVVSTDVTRTDKSPTAPAMTARCSARVGSTRLRTSSTVVPRSEPIPLGEGQARCAFRAPRTARGKLVRGTITASAAGVAVTRPFSVRIR